jgi:hypothetical protein
MEIGSPRTNKDNALDRLRLWWESMSPSNRPAVVSITTVMDELCISTTEENRAFIIKMMTSKCGFRRVPSKRGVKIGSNIDQKFTHPASLAEVRRESAERKKEMAEQVAQRRAEILGCACDSRYFSKKLLCSTCKKIDKDQRAATRAIEKAEHRQRKADMRAAYARERAAELGVDVSEIHFSPRPTGRHRYASIEAAEAAMDRTRVPITAVSVDVGHMPKLRPARPNKFLKAKTAPVPPPPRPPSRPNRFLKSAAPFEDPPDTSPTLEEWRATFE